VTLRFKAEKRCAFAREKTYDDESPTYHRETTGIFGTTTTTQKVVTKITDYYWTFTTSYELFVFQGNNPETKVLPSLSSSHLLSSSKCLDYAHGTNWVMRIEDFCKNYSTKRSICISKY
jgi:hypothetical protein